MKIKKIALAALAAASLMTSTAQADLVTNGDFSAGGANWTLSGNTGFNSYPDLWRNGAVGSEGIISQTIATLAGHIYDISFDASTPSGYIRGILDGTEFAFVGTGHFSFLVTASQNNSTLSFASRNDPSFNSLDNILVTDTSSNVPEPASLALLGLGLVGLVSSRRRKTA